MPKQLLLIEDDLVLADSLRDFLTKQSYTVDHAASGSQGLAMLSSKEYHLIILDVGLPQVDGFTICQRLRSSGINSPVLFLSAHDQVQDIVLGLTTGGDGYLTKPFHLAELLARTKALLRRPPSGSTQLVELGVAQLDPGRKIVTREGKVVPLRSKEYEILHMLVMAQGRIMSRDEIALRISSERRVDTQGNTVDVHISRIRHALGHNIIETVHSRGYRINLPEV